MQISEKRRPGPWDLKSKTEFLIRIIKHPLGAESGQINSKFSISKLETLWLCSVVLSDREKVNRTVKFQNRVSKFPVGLRGWGG